MAGSDAPSDHPSAAVVPDRGVQAITDQLRAELALFAAQQWPARTVAARSARFAHLDDEPSLVSVIAQAAAIARHDLCGVVAAVQPGRAGTVVAVYGSGWGLAARLAGPVLIVTDDPVIVWRVDGDRSWSGEIAAALTELVSAHRPARAAGSRRRRH